MIENTSQFNEDFIKNYNEELHKQHNNLRYLPEIMKIEKVKKLLANLHGKIGVKLKYVIHMKSLKQSLNHELILKNSSLKPYVDMNTDLRKKNQNMIFFFISISDTIFEKTMENVGKHRDVKLVTTERRKNYLVSEPNYQTAKFFTENLLAIENEKNGKIHE